jgi:osomolarity two-component system response regulator SKN7
LNLLTFIETADQNVKVEDIKNLPIVSTPSNNWSEEEQAAIPIESILTDLFLPSTAPSSSTAADNTASVAAAAAQLNGGSLIGSSIKTPDGGLTFLALGRLASNTNAVSVKTEIIPNNNIQQVMNSNNQQQQQQDNHVVTSETGATQADNKGKKKMVASWTTPPRVLLVDDDSVYRDVSGRMLNMIGCSIDLAKDGLEALQKMSVEKYDLILMVSHFTLLLRLEG